MTTVPAVTTVSSGLGALGPGSSVCALVPHFACEDWLDDTLTSLAAQTRPLDAIVVIDDASPDRARLSEVCAAHPQVTVLGSDVNVGPYALIQAIIDEGHFDAYLFADADDFSVPDRLATLLDHAAVTGADLVGSFELRVLADAGEVMAVPYPTDVNGACETDPSAFALLHPTSVISAALLDQLGGFATGLRFSGDAELLARAVHAARVVNAPFYGYVRRKRARSLTTAPETGLTSLARLALHETLRDRARTRTTAAQAGEPVDLAPLALAETTPVLSHLSGPRLAPAVRSSRPTAARTLPKATTTLPVAPAPSGRPRGVIVCGPPRSGQSLIATALGQHRSCSLVLDSTWTIGVGRSVLAEHRDLAAAAGRGIPVSQDPRVLAAAARRSVDGLAHELREAATSPWGSWATVTGAADVAVLAAMFPDAALVVAVRDPDAAVESLATKACGDGLFADRDTGYGTWQAAMSGLCDAAAAWPDRVRVVTVAGVHTDPAGILGPCLAAVGLEWDPLCAAPLNGIFPDADLAAAARDAAAVPARAATVAFYDTMTAGTGEHPGAAVRLANALTAACTTADAIDVTSPSGRYRAFVSLAVPAGAVAAVISKGDPGLVDLPGRVGVHVMAGDDGAYLGHHPGDGAAAIAAVEWARARGARFLVVPGASRWWLDHYDGLADHLAANARLIASHADIATVYELTTSDA